MMKKWSSQSLSTLAYAVTSQSAPSRVALQNIAIENYDKRITRA